MILFDGIIIWIHLLAACIWVGGSIFIGLILAPMLKNISNSVEERLTLMIKIGRRFNKFAFPSLIILIVSGIYNSRFFFENPNNFIESDYGIFLFIKIILTIITFISYVIHIKTFGKEIENKILKDHDPRY
ncbi:MAG: copper-binding protein, partial [Nitrososphaeraceae archaeon]|nr:copper-binding protein [Nitrososphaeraceae archaeon]